MAKKIIVFISLFLLVGCTNIPYKNTFITSGTYLEVSSSSPQAASICYQEFQRLDKIFNLYDETSELSRLNSTYGKPIKVSAELIEVIQTSRKVYDLSQGSFDISHGKLYKFWKQLIQEGLSQGFPTQESVDRIKQIGGMSNIVVNLKNSTVTIKQKGLIIDLGAIAKGYMIDKAISRLEESGIADTLVNAGGDLRCLGSNNAKSWKVGIRDPRKKGKVLAVEKLANEAIATSGDYEQFFRHQGQRYSHLINPRTGYPVQNNIASVSVISKDCITADSLATAFFVMGREKMGQFLEKNYSTRQIFVITFTD